LERIYGVPLQGMIAATQGTMGGDGVLDAVSRAGENFNDILRKLR